MNFTFYQTFKDELISIFLILLKCFYETHNIFKLFFCFSPMYTHTHTCTYAWFVIDSCLKFLGGQHGLEHIKYWVYVISEAKAYYLPRF